MARPLAPIPGEPKRIAVQEETSAFCAEVLCGGEYHTLVYLPKMKLLVLEDHPESTDPYASKAMMELDRKTIPQCYFARRAFENKQLWRTGWKLSVIDQPIGVIHSLWDMTNLADKIALEIKEHVGTGGSITEIVKKTIRVLRSYSEADLRRELKGLDMVPFV